MKNINSRRITAVAAIVLGALAVIPVSLRADERPNRDSKSYQVISFDERITSFNGTNGTLDGNVVLAGKFNDKGTRHEQFKVISASNDGSTAVIDGTGTITTAGGTIDLRFTGTIHFVSAGFYYVEGPEIITGGAGAFAAARGKGSFVATQDNTDGAPHVVGTLELKMQSDKKDKSDD
ncbi:MAG: hypothetical protein ACR2HH_02115 [Chthoniobacterales bacterium]